MASSPKARRPRRSTTSWRFRVPGRSSTTRPRREPTASSSPASTRPPIWAAAEPPRRALRYNVSNASSAATFVDTVNFGSGIATVTDNLAYSATSTTTGNLLELTGTLHGEILAFSTAIANTTSTLGAATSVTATTLSQAVSLAEVGHRQYGDLVPIWRQHLHRELRVDADLHRRRGSRPNHRNRRSVARDDRQPTRSPSPDLSRPILSKPRPLAHAKGRVFLTRPIRPRDAEEGVRAMASGPKIPGDLANAQPVIFDDA